MRVYNLVQDCVSWCIVKRGLLCMSVRVVEKTIYFSVFLVQRTSYA